MIPYCILVIEDDDDREFMEELFFHYKKLMYHEIYKIAKNEWDAEDIMQSTLLKLIDKISLLRSLERNQRINYIISSCKNTAQNYIRDHSRSEESPYEHYLNIFNENDDHLIEFRLIKDEEQDSLARIWPKLSERDRRLLEDYYILERPMEELGPELNIKPASVRMALTRARKSAYALLKKELEIQK